MRHGYNAILRTRDGKLEKPNFCVKTNIGLMVKMCLTTYFSYCHNITKTLFILKYL